MKKDMVRAAVAHVDSISSLEAHTSISRAVQPEMDSITEMQHNCVGGRYRPDIAVRSILELEDARRGIMLACDALHRALHRSCERAKNVIDRAEDRI